MIQTASFCDICGSVIGAASSDDQNYVFNNHNNFEIRRGNKKEQIIIVTGAPRTALDICDVCRSHIQKVIDGRSDATR